MGGLLCCCSEPVNFDGEVDLYHFDLHRAVGKGAFGKGVASFRAQRFEEALTHFTQVRADFPYTP